MKVLMIGLAIVASLTGAAGASLVIVSHALFVGFPPRVAPVQKLRYKVHMYVSVHMSVCESVQSFLMLTQSLPHPCCSLRFLRVPSCA